MTDLRVIGFDAREFTGTALLASDDSIWIAVHLRWWDVATALWWWLTPTDKKAYVILHTTAGRRVRTRAIRVARRHVRIRHAPIPVGEDTPS